MTITVLSLFDGMACARIALDRLGISCNYYASEIDKYSMDVALKNYPDIVEIGDITKWREWNIPQPDLIIAGSPCQGFSIAGQGLNFDDPRSKLFFVFADILKHYNPTWFVLENVRMKKEWQDVISDAVGVQPVFINSALVSAQSRPRLYWTNIQPVNQPEDKGILLKDIVLNGLNLKHTDAAIEYMNSRTPDGKRNHWDFKHHSDTAQEKSACVVANFFTGVPFNVLKDSGAIRKFHPIECERLQTVPDNYTAVGASGKKISDTQRYKMLGNGFTVDVIAHILKGILK